jgi:sulfate adenylyltransferase
MSGIEVLFVCTANICRSPYMQLYAAHRLPGDSPLRLASAGTHGFRSRPMDETMGAELLRRGIDTSAFRSRRLTHQHLDEADLVVTAELSHHTFILEEHPSVFRKVFTLGQLAEVLDDLDQPLRGGDLVRHLTATGARPRNSPDVVDPYARGPRAAAACASRLSGLLDRVLHGLVPEAVR